MAPSKPRKRTRTDGSTGDDEIEPQPSTQSNVPVSPLDGSNPLDDGRQSQESASGNTSSTNGPGDPIRGEQQAQTAEPPEGIENHLKERFRHIWWFLTGDTLAHQFVKEAAQSKEGFQAAISMMQLGARSGQLFCHGGPEISQSAPFSNIPNTFATPPMDIPQHIQPVNIASGEQFVYDGQHSFEGWVDPTLCSVDYGGSLNGGM